MQTWEASFGDIDLSPTADNGDVTVEVHGLKRGKHTRITAVADSLIQDGSIERVVRDDNRDVQLILCLDGTDSEALAQFEADLFREVNRGRNEFRWTPPDGFGATAVFDVLWADLAFADEDAVWDLDEIRGRRNYVLTMRCLPFARSVDPFTVQGATSSGAGSVLVDGGTTATGWSTSTPGEVVTSDGDLLSMACEVDATGQTHPDRVIRTGTFDATGTPMLAIDWEFTSTPPRTDRRLEVSVNGGRTASPAGTVYSSRAGFTRSLYYLPPLVTQVTSIEIKPRMGVLNGEPNHPGTLRIDKIERTDQPPSTGSLRQKSSTVVVPGSARTPTSLEVHHASTGLGNVLVYTGPSLESYLPAMSPFRTSPVGNDTATVSGKRGTGATYSIPAAVLPPGQFQLLVRHEKTATYSSTAALQLAGVDVGVVQSGAKSVEVLPDDGTGYSIHSHGTFYLPPHDVPMGTSATVRLTLATATGSGQVDEVWLFHMPDDGSAHLSLVPSATRKRLWLDTASLQQPYPACFVGNAADRSDAFGVNGATSNWDEHVFVAGSNEVFVVTTTTLDAQVEVEGHARWLTHPAA